MIDFAELLEAGQDALEHARGERTDLKVTRVYPAKIRNVPTPQTNVRKAKPRPLTIAFTISSEHGPALRSAIEEISNELGGRLEGPHKFTKEDALTYAAVALGQLRAAINEVVPNGDPDYA